MPGEPKSLLDLLKSSVRKRANLRSVFTREDKRVSSIIQSEDGGKVQLLKVIQTKLLESKDQLRLLDDQIQDLHMQLDHSDLADQDFEECDILYDNHGLIMNNIADYLSSVSARSTTPSTSSQKVSKHSSVKLPKMNLPVFSGDRRKWTSFWDVFQSEIHECQDISNVTKFNYLKGQLSDGVKRRVEGILASDDNYGLLVQTLLDNYGNKTAIKNAHCTALVFATKPQYNAISLRSFYDGINADVRSLSTLGLEATTYGEFYVPVLLEKLPTELLAEVLKLYPDDNPSLDQLLTCIHTEVKKLEQVAYIAQPNQQSKIKSTSHHPKTANNGSSTDDTNLSGTATSMPATHQASKPTSQVKRTKPFQRPAKVCQFCKGQHSTFQCTLPTDERFTAAKKANLCFNCLKDSHTADLCTSEWKCSVCRQAHHTTLHGARLLSTQTYSKKSSSSTQPSTTASTVLTIDYDDNQGGHDCTLPSHDGTQILQRQTTTSQVLLKTAVATAQNFDITSSSNLFIDEGSTLSYITIDHAAKLDIKPFATRSVRVDTFGGRTLQQEYDVGSVSIITEDGPVTIETHFKDTIVQPIDCRNWSECLKLPHLRGLTLADNFQHTSFPVDILIGADSVWQFLKTEVISGYPTAQASSLGYLLSGPVCYTSTNAEVGDSATQCSVGTTEEFQYDVSWLPDKFDSDFYRRVHQAFQIESLGINDSRPGTTDREFIDRFISQIEYRDHTYFAPLPWLDDHPPLKSNLRIALNRLQQVKQRLLKLRLWEPYDKIISDQLVKGYIEPIPEDLAWIETNAHYLSHFFVLRPGSETTPLRVVFAANAGTVSLNDCLQTGPCLLKSLFELLQRFRLKKYAFVADIEKAFLRIKLLEGDRDYVRFIWFEDGDPNKPLKVYRYTSVFFGGTSSPFILNAVIIYHLSKYIKSDGSSSSKIAEDLQSKLYCDNVLSGDDDEHSAINYYQTSRQIMRDADMNLRQWFTNSTKLQDLIDIEGSGSSQITSGLLGMVWDIKDDTIQFPTKSLVIPQDLKFTKRLALSRASSLFDPIGFISPVVVLVKKFISDLWTHGTEWDEELSPDLLAELNGILREVELASAIPFDRYLRLETSQTVQLHVFCDACPSTAVACVAYLVQGDTIVFTGSKYKVASSKHKYTVPRWELISLLIGARFATLLIGILKKDFVRITSYFWTDSTICLYWISATKKQPIFVQNRVEEIRQLTDVASWSHVSSEDNPADILSRGCSSSILQNSLLWQFGPTWLKDPDLWPKWSVAGTSSEELVTLATIVNGSNNTGNLSQLVNLERFSSYTSLLRTVAYVLKFVRLLKGQDLLVKSHCLQASEIHDAEVLLLQKHQQVHYSAEIEYLGKSSTKPKPQLINQLNLQLDRNGILVAPGRLEHAMLNNRARFPVLLAKDSIFTALVVRSVHTQQLHSGVSCTINALRKKFWIPSTRRCVSKILRKCVTCIHQIGKPFVLPLSPALPDFRLNRLKPFSSLGIDYTGHLMVKLSGQKVKCYICLFACSTTRCINLEIVNDQSADQFIQAFRRHCASYGTPDNIICDNAKTFLKAADHIHDLHRLVRDEKVQSFISSKRITIRHIPAKSPHWGGMYERLIGVVKNVLKKVLGRTLIDLNEMLTLVKEVQAVVNDRPLTYVSGSINDLQPITPSKLLLGYEITALPHPVVDDQDVADDDYSSHDQLNKVFKRRSLIYGHFVKRFQSEYYATLRERHTYQVKKRTATSEVIKVGDVVLVHDKDLPRSLWKLALVKKLLRGQDGLVRAAEIRTNHGKTNRSIHLLYPLEVSLNDPEEYFTESNTIPQTEQPRRSKRIAEQSNPRPQYVE